MGGYFTAFCHYSSLEHPPAASSPSSFEATLSFPLQGLLALSTTCQIFMLPVLHFGGPPSVCAVAVPLWSVVGLNYSKFQGFFCWCFFRCFFSPWPNINQNNLISDQALYKMCNTIPLSTKVEQLWWSIFSHVQWIYQLYFYLIKLNWKVQKNFMWVTLYVAYWPLTELSIRDFSAQDIPV